MPTYTVALTFEQWAQITGTLIAVSRAGATQIQPLAEEVRRQVLESAVQQQDSPK